MQSHLHHNMSHVEQFGIAADGTPLQWSVIKPSGTGPWPSVVMAHIGGWRTGTMTEAALMNAANDLVAAGIICFSVGYRMDRHHVPGQTQNCYWPYQTDDLKMAVLKARSDTRCNGKVGGVGGSAGGTHTLSIAIESGSTDVGPAWTAADRVLASICLSPPTQFDNRDPDPGLTDFVTVANLYCNTTNLSSQAAMSPTAFIDNTASPLFVAASEFDPQPAAQFTSIKNKIEELSIPNCETRLILGSNNHAFANWDDVKGDAIPWLLDKLS